MNNSFQKQYNEDNHYYEWFKMYLNQNGERSLKSIHNKLTQAANNAPDIEQLTLISNKWKWVNRALDYDCYNNLLLQHEKSRQRLHDLNERLNYLNKLSEETIKDNEIPIKDKLTRLEKIAKNEVILTSEIQKSYQNIKKISEDWREYEKNKYNFEADKQKELLKAYADYQNGFITPTEYGIITKDYPEQMIQQLEQQYENPLSNLTTINTTKQKR